MSVNDCMYYLRAPDVETRQKWVDGLEAVKVGTCQHLYSAKRRSCTYVRYGFN